MTIRKDQSRAGQTGPGIDGTAEDEIYIVRIYRKNMHDKHLLVGTIEDIARNYRKAFKSREELVALLLRGVGSPDL